MRSQRNKLPSLVLLLCAYFFSYLSKFCHLLFFSCSVFKWYMCVYANNYTHRNLVMIVEKRYLAQIFTTNQE